VIVFPAMTNKKARQACRRQREILTMTILGEAQATRNSGGGIDPIERARRDGIMKGLGVVPGVPDVICFQEGRCYGVDKSQWTGCGKSPSPTRARSARTASKPSSMMLLQTRIFDQCTRRSPNAQRVETCCQRQRWSAGGLNVTARGGFRATKGGFKCQTGVTTA
jgi:hypothetical protein